MADPFFELLVESSRTFALNIPLLSEPARTQATLAYLILRIADTLEDGERWSAERRIEELMSFARLLVAPAAEDVAEFRARVLADPPTAQKSYVRLLERSPEVLAAFGALPVEARGAIALYSRMTIEGMASTLEQLDPLGRLALRDLEELRRYCYFVAGLVGELLTELFLQAEPALQSIAPKLRASARLFGEGLQLTNILKDRDADAREGRVYLPPEVPPRQVLALARADLKAAASFTVALFEAGASKGLWAFAALPIRLAWATLDAVERSGAGAKVPRTEIARIVAELHGSQAPGAFLSIPVRA